MKKKKDAKEAPVDEGKDGDDETKAKSSEEKKAKSSEEKKQARRKTAPEAEVINETLREIDEMLAADDEEENGLDTRIGEPIPSDDAKDDVGERKERKEEEGKESKEMKESKEEKKERESRSRRKRRASESVDRSNPGGSRAVRSRSVPPMIVKSLEQVIAEIKKKRAEKKAAKQAKAAAECAAALAASSTSSSSSSLSGSSMSNDIDDEAADGDDGVEDQGV